MFGVCIGAVEHPEVIAELENASFPHYQGQIAEGASLRFGEPLEIENPLDGVQAGFAVVETLSRQRISECLHGYRALLTKGFEQQELLWALSIQQDRRKHGEKTTLFFGWAGVDELQRVEQRPVILVLAGHQVGVDRLMRLKVDEARKLAEAVLKIENRFLALPLVDEVGTLQRFEDAFGGDLIEADCRGARHRMSARTPHGLTRTVRVTGTVTSQGNRNEVVIRVIADDIDDSKSLYR